MGKRDVGLGCLLARGLIRAADEIVAGRDRAETFEKLYMDSLERAEKAETNAAEHFEEVQRVGKLWADCEAKLAKARDGFGMIVDSADSRRKEQVPTSLEGYYCGIARATLKEIG